MQLCSQLWQSTAWESQPSEQVTTAADAMTTEGRSLRPRKKQTHIEDFSASEAEEDVSPKKAQRGAKRAAGPARAKQPAKRSKTIAQRVEGDKGATESTSEQPSTPDIKGKGPAAEAAKREQEAQHAAPIQDKLPDSVEAEERKTVHINRAPVLTLWVTKVAEREGFSRDAGLTFGKSISGMLAHSKGRAIGIFEGKEKDEAAAAEKRQQREDAGFAKHSVFGMEVWGKEVDEDGDVRALDGNHNVVNAASVQSYLKRAFGDQLEDAEAALKALADSKPPGDIGKQAYHLYERFRPTVQSGTGGWGQKAELRLDKIRDMATEK